VKPAEFEPSLADDALPPTANDRPGNATIVSRRRILATLGTLGLASSPLTRALAVQISEQGGVTREMIAQAEWIAGIELTDEQRDQLAKDLQKNLSDQAKLRAIACDADVPPSVVFRPDFFAEPDELQRMAPAKASAPTARNIVPRTSPATAFPASPVDIAFAGLQEQASWLAQGKLSSVELTELYLQRLERLDPELLCVVTLLREPALAQAQASDRRRQAGQSLGLLDGIPWVAKDLIAVPPWKTTWGAEPYQNQVRPNLATVAERLQSAGGVLLAKVSLGALAWGDIWFGGTTRNPWQPEQGSSGSSAGSAAAVAAGLATYAIGSETLGSIVSPCVRCRVSGLRPTYGRVSRYGCMPLAWSFDKLGPIARRVDDLPPIFAAIQGPDGRDPSVIDRPFDWPTTRSVTGMKIGIASANLTAAEQLALDWLLAQGAQKVELQLPQRFPLSAMTIMLTAEATTMFDDLLRDQPDADMGLWPESFRKGQYVSAVQYLRACRLRSLLVRETEQVLRTVDVLLGADDLSLTNLSGHPSLVVSLGTDEPPDQAARPAVIKLTGAMFQEATLLAVGQAVQSAIPPTPDRPKLAAQ